MQFRQWTTIFRWTMAMAWLSLMLATGCESLHRDVDPVWDDAGVSDADAGENDDQECSTGDRCGPCDQGQTVCESDGRQVCDGPVDLDVDDDHCGQCDNACSTDFDGGQAYCDDGQCAVECSQDGETFCEDEDLCTDLESDDDHCGECSNDCSTDIDGAESFCEAGQCIVECADPVESPCEAEGICTDLDSDDDHCGTCGERCVGQRQCVDGDCQS